jgi:hypothetical protein
MKKVLLGTCLMLLASAVFAQNESMQVNFWPRTGLNFDLKQDGAYVLLRQKKQNGNFFLVQITGKDADGKNQYAKNVLVFTPMYKIESSGVPLFTASETLPVNAILSSSEEYGSVAFDMVVPMPARNLILTSSTVVFSDTEKYKAFQQVVQGMKAQ